MKKAFNYMFLDNKLFSKTKLLLFITVLPLCMYSINIQSFGFNVFKCICITLLCLISFAMIEGYKLSIVKFLDTTSSPIVFPAPNYKKILASGLKYIVALAILMVPLSLIFFAFTFAYINVYSLFPETPIKNILGILCLLSIVFYVASVLYFIPAGILVYLKTNSVWSFYKFEEILAIIFSNFKNYTKFAIVYFLLTLVVDITIELIHIATNNSLFGLVWILLVPVSFVIVYFNIVMSYIIVKIKEQTKIEL